MIENVESIKSLSAPERVEYLREMLRAKMLEKGGGAVPQSTRSAAAEAGITQPTLSTFLAGTANEISAETCILLARYLSANPILVLRLLGHDEVADALVGIVPEPELMTDPYLAQIGKALQGLNPEGKGVIVQNSRSLARVLRENLSQTQNTIGGENEGPKPKRQKATKTKAQKS